MVKNMEKIIEFKNVSKTYDSETHALNDISIEIEKGEFAFIVGASGAGKSTFLKLIMHEESPTSGTIIVNGTNVTKLRRKKVPYLRRNIGMVFQDFRLIDKMTVYDNVAFAMRAIGSTPAAIKKRVPYILGLVGLSHKIKNRPGELSGGEQQRVSLARALVNNPAIIIADEPTGNIDPEMSFEIIDLLTKINEQAGTTVIVVTHERELVKQFNKRVIEIEKGRVVNDTKEPAVSLDDLDFMNDEIKTEKDFEVFPETDEDNSEKSLPKEPENNEPVEEPEEEPEKITEKETTPEPEEENTLENEVSDELSPQEILKSLSERKNDNIDDISVDEVLAELRGQTNTKDGED